MAADPDPVLSLHEVADLVGRHYLTVRRWLAADPQLLRGTKRGNRWYIRRSAVEEFLGADTAA